MALVVLGDQTERKRRPRPQNVTRAEDKVYESLEIPRTINVLSLGVK